MVINIQNLLLLSKRLIIFQPSEDSFFQKFFYQQNLKVLYH
jgi:hypothetical protein